MNRLSPRIRVNRWKKQREGGVFVNLHNYTLAPQGEGLFRYLPGPGAPLGFKRPGQERIHWLTDSFVTDLGTIPKPVYIAALLLQKLPFRLKFQVVRYLSRSYYTPAYLCHDDWYRRHWAGRETPGFDAVNEELGEGVLSLQATDPRRYGGDANVAQIIEAAVSNPLQRQKWEHRSTF